MEATNIWNKCNIHGRKTLIACFLILGVCASVSAQVNRHLNLPNYDDRQLHYGFQIGLNVTQFKINQSDYFVQQDSVQSVKGVGTPGFSLGFILNYRLGEFFDVRLLPAVSFYERKINFRLNQVDNAVQAVFEASYIEFPLVVKYKSYRRGNSRMYMVAGVKPAIEVGGRKDERQNDELQTTNFDLSAEFGFGTDIYFPLFKFAPELRFSIGLLNLYREQDNVLSRSIESQTTHSISLYIMFE